MRIRSIARECRKSVHAVICRIRGELIRRSLKFQGGGRVILQSPGLPIRIIRHPSATIILRGTLSLSEFMGSRLPVYLWLGEGSRLIINGDFDIGNGCSIHVGPGATLQIGGREKESAAGITERSRIMVRSNVQIGKDFISSWNVFITDCDWHEMEGQVVQEDVHIGDHVWIAPGCSILKGSQIGNGCIVATGATLHKITVPDNCLVGGTPARVLARDRNWKRDLKPTVPADSLERELTC